MPDIHSAVTAKADDALGPDALLSFRLVLTGLYIGIVKQARHSGRLEEVHDMVRE